MKVALYFTFNAGLQHLLILIEKHNGPNPVPAIRYLRGT